MDAVAEQKTTVMEKASQEEIVAHCAWCGCERVFLRRRVRHSLHLLATVLTLGLWLVPWLAVCIEGALCPWRCEGCGRHNPDLKLPLQEALQMGEAALRVSRRQTAIRVIRRDLAALFASSAASARRNNPGSK